MIPETCEHVVRDIHQARLRCLAPPEVRQSRSEPIADLLPSIKWSYWCSTHAPYHGTAAEMRPLEDEPAEDEPADDEPMDTEDATPPA